MRQWMGRRRGANAIEFALVAPVLMAMLAGLTDYGWYFWREALLINGLREAVRSGGIQSQLTEESGTSDCSKCIAAASNAVQNELSEQGYSSVTLVPTIERIPATGTPCTYAVTIDATIPHERIFALVPGPDSFEIRVLSMAQNLVCE